MTAKSPIDINVLFGRPDATYNAGDTIHGEVLVNLAQETTVKAISLRFLGSARVCWSERRTYTKGSAPSISRKNTEVYLDEVLHVIRSEKSRRSSLASCIHFFPSSTASSTTTTSITTAAATADDKDAVSDEVILPSGQHRFPFDFPLSRSLPSSFDGQWGQLHYSVRATLDRPWKHAVERERAFVVYAAVRVIDDAELTFPIRVSGEFQSGLLCCVGQPVRVEMTIERRGYTIGDSMQFKVNIRNTSKRKLYQTKVALMQHATFRAGDKVKKQTKTVCSVMKGEILAGTTVSWQDDCFTIPRVPPTSCKECKVVQLKYTVAVCIHYSAWSQAYTLSAPIVIGTIPLKRASTGCSLDFILGGISLDGASRRSSRNEALPLHHSFANREARQSRPFHSRQLSLPEGICTDVERQRHQYAARERSSSMLPQTSGGGMSNSKTLLPTLEELEAVSKESSIVTFT